MGRADDVQPRPPITRALRSGCATAYAAGGLPAPGEIVWMRGPADLAPAWVKRRNAAGDNVRALVIDAMRRKTENAVDRAIALSVRMALANEPGLSRVAEFCISIDEAVLGLSEKAQPALRMRLANFFQRNRRWHRLSFAASGFSLMSAPWLGTMHYLHDVAGLMVKALHCRSQSSGNVSRCPASSATGTPAPAP